MPRAKRQYVRHKRIERKLTAKKHTATSQVPREPSAWIVRAMVVGTLALVVGIGLFGQTVLAKDASSVSRIRVRDSVPVTAMDQTAGPASNSPSLLAHPADPRFLVIANRLDAPDFGCALQVSGDGGRGWISVNPVPKLPSKAEKCYAPEVAFDRNGVLHYLFVGLHGTGNEPMGAFLTTSDDGAATFSPPRRVLGPLNFAVRMAIDPELGERGRIHLVWLHATTDPPLGGFGPPPNPILASHSDDGGRTFSDPVQVSDAERHRVIAPALVLGSNHTVHVAYYDLKDDIRDYSGLEGPTWEGTWSLVVSTSTDAGRRFGRSIEVDESIRPAERVMLVFTMPPPSLVADTGTRVCVSWTDARHGDADALLRCSPDNGESWGKLRRINDDPLGNGRRQYLPRLDFSPGGRLDVVFYDRRDDPENVLNSVYFAYSTDGGRRFAPNVRLTSESFESRIGQRYVNVSAQGQVEFGARLALLSENDRAVAAWTDTGNSKRLAGGTGQDIFATEVSITDTESMGGVIGGSIAAVGVILLIGAFLAWSRRGDPARSRQIYPRATSS